MKIDLSQFRQTFLIESEDHLATMESGLLTLRDTPADTELLNGIFRAAHSIKGGAGSFGLKNVVRFTHALENLLDRMRALEIAATNDVVAVLLKSVDMLRLLLEPDAPEDMPSEGVALIASLHVFTEHSDLPQAASSEACETGSASGEDPIAEAVAGRVYKIEFQPHREMFRSGSNPLLTLRNLADLGTVVANVIHMDALPSLAELDPEQCYLAWTVTLATDRPEEEIREVFEFIEHLADFSIAELPSAAVIAVPASPRPLDQIVAPVTETTATRSAAVLAMPVELNKTVADRRVAERRGSSGDSGSIRVDTEKVDRLIDLVGELVIAHVMTAQMVENFSEDCLPRLRASIAAMERNTRELHERVMGVRMLPVGSLFNRYARTVYDIAQATGKQIVLHTDGEETEIDKSMLELLGDPLTHLIRNAADHGIESPDARTAAGKPEQGTIDLCAFYRSGRVVIELSDDGAGIDPVRVRAKAVERGLISASAQLSDEQLRMLIFEPGFSTREAVSDLSGRGVGMDVVKQNVSRLSGIVTLSSVVGEGSTVSIELPLTLAILEGLLVRISDRTLVLPLLSVLETVCPTAGQIQRVAEQGEVVVIRGESIPLLRLSRFLGLAESSTVSMATRTGTADRRLVVVVEAGRRKIGLVIDELLGQQQVVVKSLEKHLQKVDGLMGATILGDGCVAPIIDIAGLSEMDLYSLKGSPLADLPLTALAS